MTTNKIIGSLLLVVALVANTTAASANFSFTPISVDKSLTPTITTPVVNSFTPNIDISAPATNNFSTDVNIDPSKIDLSGFNVSTPVVNTISTPSLPVSVSSPSGTVSISGSAFSATTDAGTVTEINVDTVKLPSIKTPVSEPTPFRVSEDIVAAGVISVVDSANFVVFNDTSAGFEAVTNIVNVLVNDKELPQAGHRVSVLFENGAVLDLDNQPESLIEVAPGTVLEFIFDGTTYRPITSL